MAKAPPKKMPAMQPRFAEPPTAPPNSRRSWLPEDPKDRILIFLSASGLLVVFYLLFFWDNYSGMKDAKVVGLLRTDRLVRRRHARTLHWHDIKKQDTVYLQDIVYTPKDTQAFVTFADGRTLELKPDSMVQFDELTVDGIQITLFDVTAKERENKEVFRLVPYPKVVKSNLLPDPQPFELRQAEYTDRARKRLSRPLEISRLRKVEKTPFALDQLTDYEIALLQPENKVFDIRANRWIQTVWTPVPLPGTKYELQLSLENSFNRYVTHRAKQNKLLVQFENIGKYYWRVKAVQGSSSNFSKVGAFGLALGRGDKKRTMIRENAGK